MQGIKAKGDIYANNFFFNDGGNVKTLLSETQKAIPPEHLNLYGLNITNKETGAPSFTIDTAGNVNMHSGSISWDAPIIEYQYSADNVSWHTTETSSDKYRREKQVGGTWGVGYQYKGKDGMNGSDANVPGYIKSTYIDSVRIESPTIRGGSITSDTTISVGTDATIGSQLYLTGEATPNHLKGVWFDDPNTPTSLGVYTMSNEALTINGHNYLNLMATELNLEYISNIKWGDNAPVARFG